MLYPNVKIHTYQNQVPLNSHYKCSGKENPHRKVIRGRLKYSCHNVKRVFIIQKTCGHVEQGDQHLYLDVL